MCQLRKRGVVIACWGRHKLTDTTHKCNRQAGNVECKKVLDKKRTRGDLNEIVQLSFWGPKSTTLHHDAASHQAGSCVGWG